MIETSRQSVYIFRGVTPDQVEDLCDLWQESVVEYSKERGIVHIETDPVSINQFVMLYEFYQYLGYHQPIDVEIENRESPYKPVLSLV